MYAKLLNKYNHNTRPQSVRKKTASRICAVQVLYSSIAGEKDLDIAKKTFIDNYLIFVLKELEINNLEKKLFDELLDKTTKNSKLIDNLISSHLSKEWKLERLSVTELCILRLAVYELRISKIFDKKTIINEYVSIFNSFCGKTDFPNAFLDKVSSKINIDE